MTSLTLCCSRRAVAANAYVSANRRSIQTLQRRQQQQQQEQQCRRNGAAAAPKINANLGGKWRIYYSNYASNCLLSMRYDLYAYL